MSRFANAADALSAGEKQRLSIARALLNNDSRDQLRYAPGRTDPIRPLRFAQICGDSRK